MITFAWRIKDIIGSGTRNIHFSGLEIHSEELGLEGNSNSSNCKVISFIIGTLESYFQKYNSVFIPYLSSKEFKTLERYFHINSHRILWRQVGGKYYHSYLTFPYTYSLDYKIILPEYVIVSGKIYMPRKKMMFIRKTVWFCTVTTALCRMTWTYVIHTMILEIFI